MSFARFVLEDPAIPDSARQQALDRLHSDPGIPQATTTFSFWVQNPHPQFAQASSKPLPASADIVIIGSGISAASIARTILQSRTISASIPSHPTVVILEARDICSGATGRNGGHIIETADEYGELADAFGSEAARKIMRFRLSHLKEMLQVAKELGLSEEAQARKVQFLSAYFGEKPWREALERLCRFKEGMPEESAEWIAYDTGSMPEDFRLSNATGVVAGPAGAIWPYKFVTGVLANLVAEYPQEIQISDRTAVESIQTDSATNKYTVKTSRGEITARHVIHCTNAHVAHLVPGLRGRVFLCEVKCQPKHLVTRGQMMLGRGFAQGELGGIAELGVPGDDEMSVYIDIHLSGALSAVFGRESWGRVKGDQVQAMWTGNMGFSSDSFAWVGQLPDSLSSRPSLDKGNGAEWVCAAFGGEGMVQCWQSGKALATMLGLKDKELGLNVPSDLSWFPEQMVVSQQRISAAELPSSVAAFRRQANL
ncbi:uncharacterized protein N7483_005840 [Penicillium malachiteum]|uniref:uncharacterized protein n=1 Tax=Penicillium malachiteum TaxID=1324776 RepID=UPI0025474635|nr:uncharacterized protein N7483_005840 [Penicillium malachiteum]KAJ5731332.1 hypothetical protein N7483_005840 [Penicillium malachiteum]